MTKHWWLYLVVGILGFLCGSILLVVAPSSAAGVVLALSVICLLDVWAWRRSDIPWGSKSLLLDTVDVAAVLSGCCAIGAAVVAAVVEPSGIQPTLWLSFGYTALCGLYWHLMPKRAPQLLERIAIAWHFTRPRSAANAYVALFSLCSAVVLAFIILVIVEFRGWNPTADSTWTWFAGALSLYVIGYFVTGAPWRVLNPPSSYDCFISYSSADHEFVVDLRGCLERHEVRTWWGPVDLEVGGRIAEDLTRAIGASRKVVFVLSESSMKSDWTRYELNKIVGIPGVLLPVRIVEQELVDGWRCITDSGEDLAARVRQLNIADFSKWRGDCRDGVVMALARAIGLRARRHDRRAHSDRATPET